MSQSDVAAWILAGTFRTRIASAHDSAFGVSYSTQQYQNPQARAFGLGRATDDSRNVGEIYGGDRWMASPSLALEYGARYAHYDYLHRRSLLSPRFGITLTSFDPNTHITAHVAQRMLAPGAEEFWRRRWWARGSRRSARSRRSRDRTSASSARASSTSASTTSSTAPTSSARAASSSTSTTSSSRSSGCRSAAAPSLPATISSAAPAASTRRAGRSA
jgi:hypothetical protein